MMFQTRKTSIDDFHPQTHDAKEESANEKIREHAARCIQKCFRSWLKHKRLTSVTLQKFDEIFASTTTSDDKISLIPAKHIFEIQRNFLTIYEMKRDSERMMKLCRYLVSSLYSDSIDLSYIGVFLVKKLTTIWISVTKVFLRHCLIELEKFSPEKPQEYRFIILRLHTLVSFTSVKNWSIVKLPEMEKFKIGMNKLCANLFGFLVDNGLYPIMKTLLIKGLCRERITLQPVALTAVITLTMRPLIVSNISEQLIQANLIHILTIPAIMHHLNTKEEFRNILSSPQNGLFAKVIEYLNAEQNLQSVCSTIGGNNTLCLLGNLCELANNEVHLFGEDTRDSCFINVVTRLLIHIQQFVGEKKSNATYWHPILGWFERPEDYSIQEVSPLIRIQISHLWTGKIMMELMCKSLQDVVKNRYESNTNRRRILSHKNVLNRTLRTWMNRNNCNEYSHNLNSLETKRITSVCSLYHTALCTLKEMKSMILTGLCFKDRSILLNLWLFLNNLWSHDNFAVSIDYFLMNLDYNAPEIKTLMLFCDCMSHYVTILDDVEMYEQQDPFKLSDFVHISYFLNHFLYKYISKNDSIAASHQNPLFTSLHTLLISIHRRDCQKSFCSPDHWLIKEIRVSCFIADLAKGKQHAIFLLSKIPHIIPHSERVILFRRYISEEKSVRDSAVNFETSSTLITIHRSSILEDGYRQLSILSPEALKGVIRVRFINEQGLDEAGIDQDGVFKEFLEETIKRVFDPSLDLFKSTSGNRLYPSSTSYVQENHLQLFEFVGRMLGKAIYEGIVIDVPFASFFVTQFCGQAGGILYSCLDELASLDCDLYRSLTMVKRYEGDVADLQLTFSVDQECMGKVVTYELKPGGKAISVTNENKIIYIHSMARFRMYVQIKDQIMAFTKGFRSIIKPEWFSLFSTPEWQRLISGDNAPLNLKDLRKYTQYYGGFHDKHRVICWLWDILDKDFSEVEKGLFLKFVTSCSRSPLLGFAHLEPPFSIRCIEVSDDEDNGDTIGSVFRGFFTIRKKDPQNRLPTSSTCFNLLKLPNYRNKQILREKLRYAVTSNTGFELS